jgi:hypothetical protein
MPLTDKQKSEMKRNRLLLYEAKIFELEMDRVAAEAAGDLQALPAIETNIIKLKQAAVAVEKM